MSCRRAPDNIGLFDGKVFGAMKPSAYYISAGRGQTVDEDALVAALRDGRIAGAGLDVFQTEPLPPDSPFWNLPNVFITPAYRRLYRRIRGFRDAADPRQYAAVSRRKA